jgi:hypothetical protein
MKFQLTTLVAVLCFQFSAFSMYDCNCSWEIDLVCIQTKDGTIIPYPNACWAECMGYNEDDFLDSNFDINYDSNCGCSILSDPVCVAANTGEIVFFPNSCWAECVGYTADNFLNSNYSLPTNPTCGCDFSIDEVCVEIEADIFMPFPNACWANYKGYTEAQFVDCQISTDDLVEAEEELHDIQVEDGSETGNLNEGLTEYFSNIPVHSAKKTTEGLNRILIKDASVFPNPTASRVYIALELSKEIQVRIDVLSSEGTMYLSLNHKATEGRQAINVDVSDLPAGLYILQVYAEKESQSLKFMKQ